jgi:hypothetical protein
MRVREGRTGEGKRGRTGHVEVCSTGVGEPAKVGRGESASSRKWREERGKGAQPPANAGLSGALGHHSRDIERRDLLLDAIVLNGEDSELWQGENEGEGARRGAEGRTHVLHSDLGDVVDLRRRKVSIEESAKGSRERRLTSAIPRAQPLNKSS